MRWTAALATLAAVLLAGDAQAQGPLTGPSGSGHAKVLVIGVDGARWDLVKRAMDGGRAPNLAQLSRDGVAGPTLLPYTPPGALTISEVGWSTIAAGVGPAKHGINGYLLNNDPRQATKNGYADFLTRAEAVRPAVSTFLASDWANIGLPKNGGPHLRRRHRRAARAGGRGHRGLLQPRRRRGDARVRPLPAPRQPRRRLRVPGRGGRNSASHRVGHPRLPRGDRARRQAHRLPAGGDPQPPRPTASSGGP